MFRRMISMLLIGSLVIVGNDALASDRKLARRQTPAQKQAAEREARHAKRFADSIEKLKTNRTARVNAKRLARAIVIPGAMEQDSLNSPAAKAQFTKAKLTTAQRDRVLHMIRSVKARQPVAAEQPVFTPQDLIELLQNPTTVGELRDGAVEAVKIIDIVIAKRTWKHFAPVADVLEAIRPQLVGFHGFIEAKIDSGEWTLATPVENVYSQPAEQTGEVVHCPVTVIKQTAELGTQTDEPVLLLKKEVATPWVTRGTATAVAGTVVCFVVAGVTMPIFVPTMAVNTAIGAGFGAFFSAGTSLWNEEGFLQVAKSMLRGAAHGGFGGAFGSCVSVFGPTLVNPIAEHAVKFGLAGCVTGAVRGIDDNEILGQALMGGALGGAFGTVYGSLKELYGYVTSLQAALDQSQQALAQSQPHVAQLEGELRAALEAGAIDKEAASQYIGQLKANLKQAVADNTQTLGSLTQANAFNQKLSGDLGLAVAENTEILGHLSEAHAFAGQQAATIAEQQAVITGQQTAAGMLQQEIEKNAAMLQGMGSELTDQLAANQELVGRVAACEEFAARSLADSTALVVSPFDMGTCPQQGMSSCSGGHVGVDFGDSGLLGAPLHEGTANTFTSCYNAGRGSQECKGMMAGIRSAAGATAVTDWFRSLLPR